MIKTIIQAVVVSILGWLTGYLKELKRDNEVNKSRQDKDNTITVIGDIADEQAINNANAPDTADDVARLLQSDDEGADPFLDRESIDKKGSSTGVRDPHRTT